MIDDTPIKGMNVLLAGASSEVEELYGWFNRRPHGGQTWYVFSPEEVIDIAAHNLVHLVIIQPRRFNAAALTALRLREISPESVIAFFADSDDFLPDSESVRTRLSHYYRLHTGEGGGWSESADVESFKRLLKATAAWHEKYQADKSYSPRYKYDVAISFAGEDRSSADDLARFLRYAGLKVFYDDFETARLWGKDLFITLYNTYSQDARYCIMLVSEAYVQKRWTVHERRAAQERVLNERDNEYLLPVRIDNTPVPGLPQQIAYLDASIGMKRVAELFLDKLAQELASRSLQ
jgi:hypothetical protein